LLGATEAVRSRGQSIRLGDDLRSRLRQLKLNPMANFVVAQAWSSFE